MWYYSHDPYEIVIFGQLWYLRTQTNWNKTKASSQISFAKKAKEKSFCPPSWLMSYDPEHRGPGGRLMWELYSKQGSLIISWQGNAHTGSWQSGWTGAGGEKTSGGDGRFPQVYLMIDNILKVRWTKEGWRHTADARTFLWEENFPDCVISRLLS